MGRNALRILSIMACLTIASSVKVVHGKHGKPERRFTSMTSTRFHNISLYHEGFSLNGLDLRWATGGVWQPFRAEFHDQGQQLVSKILNPFALERNLMAIEMFLSGNPKFPASRLIYLDLGANTPDSSVGWFKDHYPRGKEFEIFAWEADPKYFPQYAEKNWTGGKVTLFESAVGTYEGVAKFSTRSSVNPNHSVRPLLHIALL